MAREYRAAVIGSNGYIGRHIVSRLNDLHCKVQRYDVESVDARDYQKIDIRNRSEIANVNLDVDYVFFLAGLTGTSNGFDRYEMFLEVNEKGLLNFLDAVRMSPYRPRVIYPSTRLVYRGNEGMPLDECAEKEGKTIYAVNKLACECYLAVYANAFSIPYTIFRICVPYGDVFAKGYSYGTLGFFQKQAAENKAITLYGDGRMKRTFTHIQDICTIMTDGSVLEQCANETLNIGGETLSLAEAASIVARKYGAALQYVAWPPETLLLELGSTVFDDTKLQKVTGGYGYRKLSEEVGTS